MHRFCVKMYKPDILSLCILLYLDWLISNSELNEELRIMMPQLKIDKLIRIVGNFINRKTPRHIHTHYRDIKSRYWNIVEKYDRSGPNNLDNED